jgi:hypothetical protein
MFAVVFFPILSFGQNEYFSTDSLTTIGIKLIDNGDLINSKLCQVKKGDKIFEYSPNEVKEFGFIDGRVYISKEIQISDSTRRVFLECLYKGKTTLYYYKGKGIKTFFFEKDSSVFVEIPIRSLNNRIFNEQLKEITKDCSNITEATKFVNYNKKSLSKLIARYNNCVLKPFPHFRYGLTLGYEFSEIVLSSDNQNENIKYFDFNYDGGFTIGLFIDKPILVSDFSFHSEVYFSNHGFSYNKSSDNKEIDFVANLSSLKVPLLIRYVCPSNNIRPFINLGLVGSFNIRNETMLFETTITKNIIEINDKEESPLIDDIQLGSCIGGGIEYKLDIKHSLFFEIRFNQQYGITDPKSLKFSGFKFVTGINF